MSLLLEKAWGGLAQMVTLSRRVLGLGAWLSARMQPFSLCKETVAGLEESFRAIRFSVHLWTWEAHEQVHPSILSSPASVSSLVHPASAGDTGSLAQCLHSCVGGADPGEEGQATALPSCS